MNDNGDNILALIAVCFALLAVCMVILFIIILIDMGF